MRAEETKIVQEKAAKIKEWVTLKLAEVSESLSWEACEGPAWGCSCHPAFFCLYLFMGPCLLFILLTICLSFSLNTDTLHFTFPFLLSELGFPRAPGLLCVWGEGRSLTSEESHQFPSEKHTQSLPSTLCPLHSF